jgi:NAD+ kinase
VRSVLLVAHTSRRQIVTLAERATEQLVAAGIEVRMLADEATACPSASVRVVDPQHAAPGSELVLALGGDGTFLRAAELARPAGVPMLGVNFGHVGFLAETDPQGLQDAVNAIVNGRYSVEERVTVDAEIIVDGVVTGTAWALNEVSIERTSRERIIEIAVAVDGRPMLRFGCDGLLCSTPTGSTAYAFSAGGPVVWPEVEALLMVPISAHALFAKPLVTSPDSVLAVEVLPHIPPGVLWCDGRRTVELPPGARVEVRRGAVPVRLARLHHASFTDRLVAKFALPVSGWRGAPH